MMNKAICPSFSECIYGLLLHAYPASHQRKYRALMAQLFADQIQEVRRGGNRSILGLWLSTMLDFIITLPREYFYAARESWRALSLNDRSPLPWKTVLLAIIPGLLLALVQLDQVTLSTPALSRPAFTYFLYIGALLTVVSLTVWIVRGRFPVWGLLPLGMLIGSADEIVNYRVTLFLINTLMDLSKRVTISPPLVDFVLAFGWCIFYCSIIILIGTHLVRQYKISRVTWRLLGVFTLAWLGWSVLENINWGWYSFDYWPIGELFTYFTEGLFIILVGMLLARQHGGLAALIVLGYYASKQYFAVVIPYGDQLPEVINQTYVYSVAWRLLVVVIAPLIMMRGSSKAWRQGTMLVAVGLVLLARFWLDNQLIDQFVFFDDFHNPIYYAMEAIQFFLIPLLVMAMAFSLYNAERRPTIQLPTEVKVKPLQTS